MDFFLDTAEVEVIKDLNETGLIDGITTNPSLVAKSGQNFFTVLENISKIISRTSGNFFFLLFIYKPTLNLYLSPHFHLGDHF